MGVFDFLFGRRRGRQEGAAPAPAGEPPGPEELRKQLFDAVAAGDAGALEQLCRRHREAIRQHFSAWRKPPDDVRDQPARMQGYVHALVSVAELFARRLGVPDLMNELTGTPESNPVLKWQQQLEQARQAMEELRYRETAELLTDLLIDVRGLRGSAADTYLPITYGYLGECYFQSAQADKAVAPTRQALELCERAGDAEGRLAYLGNLYEIHRYLGQAEEAAGYAERLRAHDEAAALLATAVAAQAAKRGLLLLKAGIYSNCIRVLCPLVLSDEELDEALSVWEAALGAALGA
jgi:tetratricopeptide (TPR) repeat protein